MCILVSSTETEATAARLGRPGEGGPATVIYPLCLDGWSSGERLAAIAAWHAEAHACIARGGEVDYTACQTAACAAAMDGRALRADVPGEVP